MPILRTETLELSYADRGDPQGSPIVLVHGWPDASRGWSQVSAGLVEAGYRVLVPDLRGTGATVFRSEVTVRDGSAVALSQDVCDLADGLGLGRFAVVGHDWGARVAYTLASLEPNRLSGICGLALGFQPRGRFAMPDFAQAQRFWYRWLMYVDAGADECDPPSVSEGLEGHFDSYLRVVLEGVGHFPHREAPERVTELVLEHLPS